MDTPGKLVACVWGMAAGFTLDVIRTPLVILQSLCRSREPGVLGAIWAQLHFMPFLHLGMLIGWAVFGISWTQLRRLRSQWMLTARLLAEFVVMGLWMFMAAAVTMNNRGQHGALFQMLIGMVVATFCAAASLAAIDASLRLYEARQKAGARVQR